MAGPDDILDHRLVTRGALLGLVASVGLGLLRFANSGPLERDLELVGTAALALVYASPSLLALLSLRGRGELLIPAIVLGTVGSVSAFSGVTLVLLIPTGMWTAAYVRALRSGHRPRSPGILAGAFVVVVLVASFFTLFLQDDPACWKVDSQGRIMQVPDEPGPGVGLTIDDDDDVVASGCTSDVTTAWEGILTIGLVGLGLLGSVSLIGPAPREAEKRA